VSKNESAQCMNCHKIFDREFLYDNFTKNFINVVYKKHKEQFISEKELTFLPVAQLEIERLSLIEKYDKEITLCFYSSSKYCNIHTKYTNICHTLGILQTNKLNIPFEDEFIKSLESRCKIMEQELRQIIVYTLISINPDTIVPPNVYTDSLSIRTLETFLSAKKNELEDNTKIVNVKSFIRQCPSNDCRGFLSSKLFCELCKITACGKCREIKEKEHECDPGVLENVKFLEKDSKGCPKCSSIIFRISGCMQMFCTMCHTAFDWKTLKIETGVIHNPHFFQFQRQQGQQDHQGEAYQQGYQENCCRQLNNDFSRVFSQNFKILGSGGKIFIDKLTCVLHIKFVLLEEYSPPQIDAEKMNQDLHIQYLEKKIDLEKFKVLVQQREKKHEKKIEIYNLLYMYTESMSDILFNLYESFKLTSITHSTTDLEIKQAEMVLEKYHTEIMKLDAYILTHYIKIRKVKYSNCLTFLDI
jgi:hypothetical protein